MNVAFDVAAVRLDNALRLFDEFVQATVRQPDAATLRGLERRFAERLQVQPSYWSQIKGRSRQIGERLARQFELNCGKPAGWMDIPHASPSTAGTAGSAGAWPSSVPGAHGTAAVQARAAGSVKAGAHSGLAAGNAHGAGAEPSPTEPRDEDERFIVGLVLTYYRRHPQRARTRLLDLLGEVLVPVEAPAQPSQTTATKPPTPAPRLAPGVHRPPPPPPPAPEDPTALWRQLQGGVAPLRKKR
jgi:hypothetical protein